MFGEPSGQRQLSKRHLNLAVVAATLMAVLLSACGGSTDSGPSNGTAAKDKKLTMKIGVQAKVFQTYYPQLADRLGYFKDENLEVQFISGENTANNVQGVISGAIDAIIGGPEGLSANEQGADIRFVAAAANRSIWDLVVAKNIKSIEDLKGQVVGVSAVQSISTSAVRQALQAHGVDPDSAKYIVAGGTNKRYAALQSGQIKAAALGIPINYIATDAGFNDLGQTDTDLGGPPLAASVITVSKKWADSHKEVLNRFLRAYQRTTDAMYDPAMTDKIVELASKDLEVDPKYMKKAMDDLFFTGKYKGLVMPPDSHIDLKATQTAADAFLEFGALTKPYKAEDAIDHSYLEAAQKSLKDDPPKGS